MKLLLLNLKTFRRVHSIRTLQINLIDLRLQFIFCHLFLIRAILDQALNIFFQLYYKEVGKEDIFNIWWLSFYLENIGCKVKKDYFAIYYILFRLASLFQPEGLFWCQETAARVLWSPGAEVSRPTRSSSLHRHSETAAPPSWSATSGHQWCQEDRAHHHHCHSSNWLRIEVLLFV